MLSIGNYTLRSWGEAQAFRYLGELEACCQQLADNPASGRSCDDIRPGLLSQGARQACDFLPAGVRGILVSRILHERMLPERHAFADEDNAH